MAEIAAPEVIFVLLVKTQLVKTIVDTPKADATSIAPPPKLLAKVVFCTTILQELLLREKQSMFTGGRGWNVAESVNARPLSMNSELQIVIAPVKPCASMHEAACMKDMMVQVQDHLMQIRSKIQLLNWAGA